MELKVFRESVFFIKLPRYSRKSLESEIHDMGEKAKVLACDLLALFSFQVLNSYWQKPKQGFILRETNSRINSFRHGWIQAL